MNAGFAEGLANAIVPEIQAITKERRARAQKQKEPGYQLQNQIIRAIQTASSGAQTPETEQANRFLETLQKLGVSGASESGVSMRQPIGAGGAFLVDTSTGEATPVQAPGINSKSKIITKPTPQPLVGFDKTTGQFVIQPDVSGLQGKPSVHSFETPASPNPMVQQLQDAVMAMSNRPSQATMQSTADQLERNFALSGQTSRNQYPGMVENGNINLSNRPKVRNPDGSISTVRSMSVNIDGKEVLIPTVSEDGRIMSNQEAIDQYLRTGKHLGKFSDIASANKFASMLHNQQASSIGLPFDLQAAIEKSTQGKAYDAANRGQSVIDALRQNDIGGVGAKGGVTFQKPVDQQTMNLNTALKMATLNEKMKTPEQKAQEKAQEAVMVDQKKRIAEAKSELGNLKQKYSVIKDTLKSIPPISENPAMAAGEGWFRNKLGPIDSNFADVTTTIDSAIGLFLQAVEKLPRGRLSQGEINNLANSLRQLPYLNTADREKRWAIIEKITTQAETPVAGESSGESSGASSSDLSTMSDDELRAIAEGRA